MPYKPSPRPTGPNNRSNPYYQRRNHVRIARNESNRRKFFGEFGGSGRNLYNNWQLVGGAPSGPVEGDNSPDFHKLGFNDLKSYPVDNGDGTFSWRFNDEQDRGRCFLIYQILQSHPYLGIGDTMFLSWDVTDLRGVATRVLAETGSTAKGVSLEYDNFRCEPNETVTVSLDITITAIPYKLDMRVGVGPTTQRTDNLIVSNPVAFLRGDSTNRLGLSVVSRGTDGTSALFKVSGLLSAEAKNRSPDGTSMTVRIF